jgi:hypothetical protein
VQAALLVGEINPKSKLRFKRIKGATQNPKLFDQ